MRVFHFFTRHRKNSDARGNLTRLAAGTSKCNSALHLGAWARSFENLAILKVFLHASRLQIASKPINFHGFRVDPIDFELKIHEISALRPKCYLNVTRTAPDVKINEFGEVLS